MVIAVYKSIVLIQHKGETGGHAGAEIEARGPKHHHDAPGHVLATVVADTFDHRMRPGIAHAETFARKPGGEQLAAGRAVQTGVTDDRRFLTLEAALWRRVDHDLAAGHALAHIIVGITLQIEMQAARVPHPETLARGAMEPDGDRGVRHAPVPVTPGDFAGQARADGAVVVANPVMEFTALLAFDSG